MSDVLKVAIIAAVPGALTGFAAVIMAFRSIQAAKKVHSAVQEVHLAVNSRLDALLALTKTASFAEGVKSEMEKRIDRIAGS